MVDNKNFLAQIIEQARLRNLEDARIQAERLRNLPSSPVLPQNLNLESGGSSFEDLYGDGGETGETWGSAQQSYNQAANFPTAMQFMPGGLVMSAMADAQRNEIAQNNPYVAVTDTPYGPYGRMMGYSDVPESYTSWTEAQPQMRDEAIAAYNEMRYQNAVDAMASDGSMDSIGGYGESMSPSGGPPSVADDPGLSASLGGGYTSSAPGGESGETMSAGGGPPQTSGDSGGGDSGSSSSSSSASSGSGMSPAAAGEDGAGDSAGDSGDGGCFITTATLENTQEADDGETLTTFRAFRDSYMKETAERRDKLKWYYDNAPQIVEDLNTHPEKDEIYQEIYNDYLCEAQDLINKGENEKAEQVYDSMVYFAEDNAKQAVALRDTQEQ